MRIKRSSRFSIVLRLPGRVPGEEVEDAMGPRIAYVLVSHEPQPVFSDFQALPEGQPYTRDRIKALLQLLGCKPRDANNQTECFFKAVEQLVWGNGENGVRRRRRSRSAWRLHPRPEGGFWVSMSRKNFDRMVLARLMGFERKKNLMEDWRVAVSLLERQRSVTVLLCGTSGTGKSTLASILATRLGITTVISTDSIRQMMRNFSNVEENPLLFASTYQAADAFDMERTVGLEKVSDKKRVLKGYKAQSEMVVEHLDHLITACENRNESIVCEGAHLSLNFVIRLMKNHPSIVPFLIYISNESKHRERLAVRSKYMTTDPARNRYIRYMENIMIIQDYLTRKADKHLIPKVDNTNVDRSVGIIHSTIFGCVKQMKRKATMLDSGTNTAKSVNQEFMSVKISMSWRGKDILEVLHSRNSGDDGSHPCTSHSTFSLLSENGEEVSTDSPFGSDHGPERIMSSDPDDEPGSNWENSSSDGHLLAASHSTDCGSVFDTTDIEKDDNDDLTCDCCVLVG